MGGRLTALAITDLMHVELDAVDAHPYLASQIVLRTHNTWSLHFDCENSLSEAKAPKTDTRLNDVTKRMPESFVKVTKR